jgi:hypothetical protein
MNVTQLKLTKSLTYRCSSCGGQFPVRRGRIQILVGLDGRLYCYATRAACVVQAVQITPQAKAR